MSIGQRVLWGWVAVAGLLAAPASNAAYLYSFSGTDLSETQTVSFSFQTPDLITTQGALSVPSFSFAGHTYTQGYFGTHNGSACFAFATANVGSGAQCGFGSVPGGESYAYTFSTFAAPTAPGIHDFTFFTVGANDAGKLVVTRLTISSVTDVPEPGTLALLGLGLLSLGLQQRRRNPSAAPPSMPVTLAGYGNG